MAVNQRVLIGFADALAAIESAWSLLDAGFEVSAFARAGTRPALARSKSVQVIEITPPENDARLAVADLAAAVRAVQPAAVLPLDDHAVWLCDQLAGRDDRLAGDGAAGLSPAIAGPTGALAALALDKREQLELAVAAGLAVPPSADAGERPPGAGPWMVKPALAIDASAGRLRRPVGRIAHTPSEVAAVAATISGPAIVQPMLRGSGEGVFGIATATGVSALSAHQRIRMMNPRGSGSSACQSIPVADDLAAKVQDFIAMAGWRGLFMVEMLRDRGGEPWFMELNGRTWGSMALARGRGFEYPEWAVRLALDPAFEPPPSAVLDLAPHLTARHLGREIVHLAAVLARGGAPRLQTLRATLIPHRGERWYNWRRSEPIIFVADSWHTVRGQLGRRP